MGACELSDSKLGNELHELPSLLFNILNLYPAAIGTGLARVICVYKTRMSLNHQNYVSWLMPVRIDLQRRVVSTVTYYIITDI